jgi:hypothetical protein
MSRDRLFGATIVITLVITGLFFFEHSAQAQSSPLWGNLKPGPYGIGFRVIKTYDHSRFLKRKYDREGKLNTTERALPLLISVWYPAKAAANSAAISFEQYLYLSEVREDFAELTEEERQQARKNLKDFFERPFNFPYGAVSAERWEQLLKTRTAAVMNAVAENGSFPLIVGNGGSVGHAVLDEYLASHAYIVARITAPPLDAEVSGLARTEFGVRNLEFLIAHMRSFPNLDRNRLAAIGMSAAGFPPYLLAMRNSEIDAMVIMESAIYYDRYASQIKPSPWYELNKLTVPFIHMFRQTESAANENLKDFEAARYSQRYRYLLVAPNLLHQDFSNYGNAATAVLGIRGKDEIAAKHAFETNWLYVLQFLNAHVKKDPASLSFLRRKPEENGVPPGFLTLEIKEAVNPAPTQTEFLTLIREQGMPRALQIYEQAKKADPEALLFSQNSHVLLGYQLLQREKAKEAIEVFKLGIAAYPAGARISVGLSEAYAAVGDKEQAIQQTEKSLSLLAGDGNLSEAQRNTLRNNLSENLKKLKAQ